VLLRGIPSGLGLPKACINPPIAVAGGGGTTGGVGSAGWLVAAMCASTSAAVGSRSASTSNVPRLVSTRYLAILVDAFDGLYLQGPRRLTKLLGLHRGPKVSLHLLPGFVVGGAVAPLYVGVVNV
jgi:hypothetical protein